MASRISPYVDNTGLVFAYDLANIKRSYLGEPTVNYIAGDTSLEANIDCSSTNATDILPDGSIGTVRRITVTANTYNGIIRASLGHTLPSSGVPQAGVSYTISCWIRNSSGVAVAAGWEPEVGQPDSYLRPNIESGFNGNYGSNSQPNTLSPNWTRVSYTYSYNSTQTSQIVPFIYFGHPVGGSGAGVGATIDFYQIQLEIKSHATPYVNGTRSVTQGLKDLTGRSTIDLTNVSFDANAQMTFDGTDDTASVNSYSAIELVDNVSIEYVYMRLSTDPILDVIANKYHSTGWELFCQTGNTFALAGRNGDGTYYSTSNAAYTIQNNKYYHLVAIKEGLSWRLYVNGGLYASLTANSVGTWSNSGILQIGGEGNGYYPNMELPLFRIYNRALTASEIQQNFNAIKGRYGL